MGNASSTRSSQVSPEKRTGSNVKLASNTKSTSTALTVHRRLDTGNPVSRESNDKIETERKNYYDGGDPLAKLITSSSTDSLPPAIPVLSPIAKSVSRKSSTLKIRRDDAEGGAKRRDNAKNQEQRQQQQQQEQCALDALVSEVSQTQPDASNEKDNEKESRSSKSISDTGKRALRRSVAAYPPNLGISQIASPPLSSRSTSPVAAESVNAKAKETNSGIGSDQKKTSLSRISNGPGNLLSPQPRILLHGSGFVEASDMGSKSNSRALSPLAETPEAPFTQKSAERRGHLRTDSGTSTSPPASVSPSLYSLESPSSVAFNNRKASAGHNNSTAASEEQGPTFRIIVSGEQGIQIEPSLSPANMRPSSAAGSDFTARSNTRSSGNPEVHPLRGNNKKRRSRDRKGSEFERELGLDAGHMRDRKSPNYIGQPKLEGLNMIGADGIDEGVDDLHMDPHIFDQHDHLDLAVPVRGARVQRQSLKHNNFAQPSERGLTSRASSVASSKPSRPDRGNLRKSGGSHNISLGQQSAQSALSARQQQGYQATETGHFEPGQPHRQDVYGVSKDNESSENTPPPINWRRGALIGRGSYGHVFLGLNIHTGEIIAVKQIQLDEETIRSDRTRVKALEQEINFLRSTSHPNVVKYLGAQIETDPQDSKKFNLSILLEYVPGGSVASLINTFGRFPVETVRVYTRQLLLGLRFLHRHGIIHRDVKGANVLVDAAGVCKLADFGASARVIDLLEDSSHSIKGTPYWMAPEVICQRPATTKVDIWALGCTVIEMADGRPPWSDESALMEVLLKIARATQPPPIPASLGDDGVDFVRKCLIRDPVYRPTAEELLQHPFVEGVSQPKVFLGQHSPVNQHSGSEGVLATLSASAAKSSSPLMQIAQPVTVSSGKPMVEDGAYISIRDSLHLARHILPSNEDVSNRLLSGNRHEPRCIPIAPPSAAIKVLSTEKANEGRRFLHQNVHIHHHSLQRSVHPAVAASRSVTRVKATHLPPLLPRSNSQRESNSNTTASGTELPTHAKGLQRLSAPLRLPHIHGASNIAENPSNRMASQQDLLHIPPSRSPAPSSHLGFGLHPNPYPTPLPSSSAHSTVTSTMHVPLVTARAPAPDATTDFSVLGLGLGFPHGFGGLGLRPTLGQQSSGSQRSSGGMSNLPSTDLFHPQQSRHGSRSAATSPVPGRPPMLGLGISATPIPEEGGGSPHPPFSGTAIPPIDGSLILQPASHRSLRGIFTATASEGGNRSLHEGSNINSDMSDLSDSDQDNVYERSDAVGAFGMDQRRRHGSGSRNINSNGDFVSATSSFGQNNSSGDSKLEEDSGNSSSRRGSNTSLAVTQLSNLDGSVIGATVASTFTSSHVSSPSFNAVNSSGNRVEQRSMSQVPAHAPQPPLPIHLPPSSQIRVSPQGELFNAAAPTKRFAGMDSVSIPSSAFRSISFANVAITPERPQR